MLCIAENLGLSEKRMHFNMLLMQFEGFLKKLYFLCHKKEVTSKEPGHGATISDAIFSIPSIKSLKYDERDAYKAFSEKLTILRQLRNDAAHGSSVASEQEVNVAINIVIDMYLFAVGTNITELEMGETITN